MWYKAVGFDKKLITEWLFIPSVKQFSFDKASDTALSRSYVVCSILLLT